jgi:hypothetical protein
MAAVDPLTFDRSMTRGLARNPQREPCCGVKTGNLKATDGGTTGIVALTACDTACFVEAVLKRSRGTTLPAVIAGAE